MSMYSSLRWRIIVKMFSFRKAMTEPSTTTTKRMEVM